MYPRYAAHELEEGEDSDSSDSEDEEDKPTSLGQFFTEGMEELLEDKGKELRDKVEPFLDYLHRYYQGMVSHALKNLQILQKKVAVPIFVCCINYFQTFCPLILSHETRVGVWSGWVSKIASGKKAGLFLLVDVQCY